MYRIGFQYPKNEVKEHPMRFLSRISPSGIKALSSPRYRNHIQIRGKTKIEQHRGARVTALSHPLVLDSCIGRMIMTKNPDTNTVPTMSSFNNFSRMDSVVCNGVPMGGVDLRTKMTEAAATTAPGKLM